MKQIYNSVKPLEKSCVKDMAFVSRVCVIMNYGRYVGMVTINKGFLVRPEYFCVKGSQSHGICPKLKDKVREAGQGGLNRV